MTESPSERLRALGVALVAAGATAPAPRARTHEPDLAAAVERLRVHVGTHEPEIPDAATLAASLDRAARIMFPERRSGWRQAPQCGGCKRILTRPDAVCPGCGYLAGAGYVGVPATTSHLERYR